jgi:hypothetical protein
MQRLKPGEVTQADILGLAVAASVDPRSARRALEGEDVSGLAGERLRKAMAERGIEQKGARGGKK